MIDLVEKGSGAPPANAFYNAGIYLMPAAIFDFTSRLEKSPRGEYEFTDALKAFVKSGAKTARASSSIPAGPTCAIPACWAISTRKR